MKVIPADEASGFSVLIAGAPGAGKTHVGAQTKGQLWILTESNGLGTIREGKEEIAFAEKPADLFQKVDPDIPVIIPVFDGSPKEKSKNLQGMAKFIKENAKKIRAAGRQTVIFDSLTDYNGFLVEAETPDDGSKIDFDSWQRVKVNTSRPVEHLKHLTSSDLDVIIIAGLQATDAAHGGSVVHGGYRLLIAGGARDTILFKMMSSCTIHTSTKKSKETGKIEVNRQAVFVGRQGVDVFKPKGQLGIEECDFYTWKNKAFQTGDN